MLSKFECKLKKKHTWVPRRRIKQALPFVLRSRSLFNFPHLDLKIFFHYHSRFVYLREKIFFTSKVDFECPEESRAHPRKSFFFSMNLTGFAPWTGGLLRLSALNRIVASVSGCFVFGYATLKNGSRHSIQWCMITMMVFFYDSRKTKANEDTWDFPSLYFTPWKIFVFIYMLRCTRKRACRVMQHSDFARLLAW